MIKRDQVVVKNGDELEQGKMACHMIRELVQLNRDIDQTIWASAMAFTLAAMFSNSGPYHLFAEFLDELKIHYKEMWNEEGPYGNESIEKSNRVKKKRSRI